jgi:hypothetical protein
MVSSKIQDCRTRIDQRKITVIPYNSLSSRNAIKELMAPLQVGDGRF